MQFVIDQKSGRFEIIPENYSPEIQTSAMIYCGYSPIPVETVDESTYIYNWYFEKLINALRAPEDNTKQLIIESVKTLEKLKSDIIVMSKAKAKKVNKAKDLFTLHTNVLCALLGVVYGQHIQQMIESFKSKATNVS